ncbi:hypothetical protein HHK36_029605 [Tetracentron sinense]|uniref:F-box domain-containing protein n=1 Tax=Tetracentron sinense TaxID=13715 RepID=A0A835D1X7_TETSI|nr:hypothetical protein HHK36_029605 [Tetracentron sinense]
MAGQNQDEDQTAPLYGDLLEAVFSHVPLIDLMPASHVSKTWRSAVFSHLYNSPRVKPWLIVHTQSRRNPSMTTIHAYDPHSHVWIEIMQTQIKFSCTLKSSHSTFLYMLSPSKFTFSFDPLNATWHNVGAPVIWRSDPVVAVVGSRVVIAGGACDFEDDPVAVEMYDIDSGKWDTCQSMPAVMKDFAASTWLSIAVTNQKMYALGKNSGIICSFDPETKRWEDPCELRPNLPIFFSVIAISGDRLVLVGLVGDVENIESLSIWDVNCDTFNCKEMGKMPPEMLERLTNANTPLSSIDVSSAGDLIYIYNPSDPVWIFYCEFTNGVCQWGNFRNLILNDRNRMNWFVFTCSKVGIDDLHKAFWSINRKLSVKLTGN